MQEGISSESDDDNYVPYVHVKQRKKEEKMKLEKLSRAKMLKKQAIEAEKKESTHDEEEEEEVENDERRMKFVGPNAHVSLLDQHSTLKKEAEGN